MADLQRSVLLVASIDAVGIARLPRLFADAGCIVSLISARHMAVTRSKFVSRRFRCEPGAEATALDTREHLRHNTYDSVVIADEPTLMAAIDAESNEWLREWFPVPLEPDFLRRVRSKIQFLVDSRQAGIPTPRFEVIESEDQLWAAVERIGFPVFIKTAHGFAGSGLVYARTRPDLERQLDKITITEPLVAQQEIAGETGSIPVVYDKGRPVCWFPYRMALTWPTRFSSACSVTIAGHPELESLVRAVGELTQFNGLCGLDWMWDRATGQFLLLEFNPRPLPTSYLGLYAGVDFSKAIQTLGTAASTEQIPRLSGLTIDLFPQALYYAFDNGQPGRFLRTFEDAPWTDPLLIAAHLRRFITHQIPSGPKRMLRRARGASGPS